MFLRVCWCVLISSSHHPSIFLTTLAILVNEIIQVNGLSIVWRCPFSVAAIELSGTFQLVHPWTRLKWKGFDDYIGRNIKIPNPYHCRVENCWTLGRLRSKMESVKGPEHVWTMLPKARSTCWGSKCFICLDGPQSRPSFSNKQKYSMCPAWEFGRYISNKWAFDKWALQSCASCSKKQNALHWNVLMKTGHPGDLFWQRRSLSVDSTVHAKTPPSTQQRPWRLRHASPGSGPEGPLLATSLLPNRPQGVSRRGVSSAQGRRYKLIQHDPAITRRSVTRRGRLIWFFENSPWSLGPILNFLAHAPCLAIRIFHVHRHLPPTVLCSQDATRVSSNEAMRCSRSCCFMDKSLTCAFRWHLWNFNDKGTIQALALSSKNKKGSVMCCWWCFDGVPSLGLKEVKRVDT